MSFRHFEVIHDKSTDISGARERIKKFSSSEQVSALRKEIIGAYLPFKTPFGTKPIIYADWTASGKCLGKLEEYMMNNVMSLYGNTHTSTSITGLQSTSFRHESRQIIAEAVNAKITGKAAQDVVLFVGNGVTGAIHKLVTALGLHIPSTEVWTDENMMFKPVVFVSAYEHHSNLLPWRESCADVVTIKYNRETGVCVEDLKENLERYKDRKLKIGSFSAASNITGVRTSVDQVAAMMHIAGGLAFFDYASAAPYVKMDMNPVLPEPYGTLGYKDAIFFSGHKFLGGPGCPGVLVIKKHLLPTNEDSPTQPGGGTVFYVTNEHHRYLLNREEREEGGTPNILGDIKMGLVMQLRQSIGVKSFEEEESKISIYAQERLRHPNIILLGRQHLFHDESNPVRNHHLPIFSFLIKRGTRFLHHNFVSSLLNDLFGIQTRGGCSCAGPFAQWLLGLSKNTNTLIEHALLEKNELLRPGFSRLSLPYWINTDVMEYILDSVRFVADHGYKFLPFYRFNPKTGEWAHSTRLTKFPDRKWLSNFHLLKDEMDEESPKHSIKEFHYHPCGKEVDGIRIPPSDQVLQQMWSIDGLENIKMLLDKIWVSVWDELKQIESSKPSIVPTSALQFDPLRWFVLFADDMQDSLQIQGPIIPQKIGSCSSYLDIDSPDTNILPSRYRELRETKLRARFGGENAFLPRYLEMMLERSTSDEIEKYFQSRSLVTQINLRSLPTSSLGTESKELLISQALENMVTSSSVCIGRDSTSPTSAASTSTSAASSPSSIAVSNDISAANAQLSVSGMQSTELDENVMTCESGTCFLRSRPLSDALRTAMQESSTPGSTDSTVKEESGKIQSDRGMCFESTTGVNFKKVLAPPKKVLKLVGEAIKDWNMIEDGDRLLLGLSGGKDSLCLLHVLINLQKRAPVRFEIACATVDPQTDSFDPSTLIPYMKELGVTYHYLSQPIVQLAKSKLQGDSLCAFCSRFKRGLLYSCCRNFKYNKLVLAQHLDDLAESFMMSALHNGQIRTMKANYEIDAGDIRVIRPLIYVRETQTRDFSVASKLPIINENCPACFEQPKERARIKKLLLQEESMVPALYFNLRRALIPFLHNDMYQTIKEITESIDANRVVQKTFESSRKHPRIASEGTHKDHNELLQGTMKGVEDHPDVDGATPNDATAVHACLDDVTEDTNVNKRPRIDSSAV